MPLLFLFFVQICYGHTAGHGIYGTPSGDGRDAANLAADDRLRKDGYATGRAADMRERGRYRQHGQ